MNKLLKKLDKCLEDINDLTSGDDGQVILTYESKHPKAIELVLESNRHLQLVITKLNQTLED